MVAISIAGVPTIFSGIGDLGFTLEVEQSITAHPSVVEAAVVAAADDSGLLKPKAYVVLKDGADLQDIDSSIKSMVKDDIGKWKYPRWVEVADDLPKQPQAKSNVSSCVMVHDGITRLA